MIQSLDALVSGYQTIAIGGHVRPDGDCLGSTLATYNYIKTWYPQTQVDLYLEEIPSVFSFLNSSDEIHYDRPDKEAYDLFIALDCGDIDRLGTAGDYYKQAKHTACIDHHKSNLAFAEVNYIVPGASSASELVYNLMDPEKVTKEIAECIYVGIVHDTGVFQYSSTTAKTMEIAGKLMAMGIDFPRIVEETFFAKSYGENRISGFALSQAKLHLDGLCISSILTKEQMDAYGVTTQDTSSIVSELRVTKGTEVAIFMYENGENTYKVSMRSKRFVDVADIAVKYGGGGHARAAGLTMTGTSEEILQKILGEIAACITES